MKHLSANELRQAWINYFKKQNHLYVESKSLIPNDDPSLLWINSGVATLKKYFSGLENPPANRLVNLQKAVRTNDIENVGKTARHHTFFEMMGNFSIGDYFKKEAIEFAYNFLIKELEIDQNLLYITVYKDDEVAYNRWLEMGIKPDHLFKEDKDRNFWDVGNGPCGPCTEIYFDRGEKYDSEHIGIKLLADDIENDRYVEIWNIVFSEFNNDGHDNYSELKRKNIDTGAGYERFLSVLQEVPTNYDTDLFLPLIQEIQKYSTYQYVVDAFFSKDEKQLEINRWFKVIADHIKSAVFMIADGAIPTNKDRGYILRRLIRRALSFAIRLQLKDGWLKALINKVIDIMQHPYPYLVELKDKIINIIQTEADTFNKALRDGLKQLDLAIKNNDFSAKTVANLVETHGLPKVLIDEICAEKHLTYNEQEYQTLFEQHQQASKADSLNNIKALAQQNKNLLELKVNSIFDYESNEFKDAKVIALFDDHFEPVQHLDGNGYVVLDKTCLYATGGGQLHDDGTINNFVVDDVIKGPNHQNLHHILDAFLSLNEIVDVKHDMFTRLRLRCNHTGVHIVEALLKRNINANIKQAGAFKNKHKFTFDFTYDKKLEPEQVKQIELDANAIINQQIPVSVLHTTLNEAKEMHATMDFECMYEKQKQLRLIKIPGVSLELCGGTHAHNTSDLEVLKITNYTSLGSGVFRIEGFTRYVNYYEHLNEQISDFVTKNNVVFNNIYKDKKNKLLNQAQFDNDDLFTKEQYIEQSLLIANNNELKLLAKSLQEDIKNKLIKADQTNTHFVVFDHVDANLLNQTVRSVLNEIHSLLIVINNLDEGFSLLVASNKNYSKENNVDLNSLVNELNNKLQGKGGGKNNYFQFGIKQPYNQELFKEFISKIK